jgi:hypothetical protein
MRLDDEGDARVMRVDVLLPPGVGAHELVEDVSRLEEVVSVRWE